MAKRFGPVYEVTHTVNRDIIASFDVWLGQHMHEMLSIQGIFRATTHLTNDAADGRPRRVAQYHFASDDDLDNYIAGPAAEMRQSALHRFNDQFEVARRILRQTNTIDSRAQPADKCLNCSTTLAGQYCGECGQRASNRLISVWELLRDAFGDLLEIDSRVWRTLIPLILKPGKLTRDYLQGRRARFMPPFRTYLVLSIVFFLVAFFDPTEDFWILLGPAEETPVATTSVEDTDSTAEVVADRMPDTAEESAVTRNGGTEPAVNCEKISAEDWPEWLSTKRVKIVCERVVANDGNAFAGKLVDNVPAALIGLLPIMALILKTLYPLSNRYYVEHLLFVVHFHAFVFLILSVLAVFSLFTSLLGLSDYTTPVTTVAVSLYIPIYLYKAMRQVYEQSLFATAIKFIVLMFSYIIGLLVILMISATIAAFSI